MRERNFIWLDTEDTEIFVYEWLPEEESGVKGIVQIVHGMSETAGRYKRFAEVLAAHGYAVFAHDQIGHGRTAGLPDRVGILGQNSFHRMAWHTAGITEYVRSRYDSDSPLFVMGHSMGSFVVQLYMATYMAEHPDRVQGVLLSGSNGKQGPVLEAGLAIAAVEAWLRGDDHRSGIIHALTFGAYNKKFAPNRTAADWLSRDPLEVDAYIADPYCGAVFTAGFYRDFFKGLKTIHQPKLLVQIRKDLPIFVFSGDRDPVGDCGKGVRRLLDMYRELGLRQVTGRLYPDGRHEMLNEINRDEVMRDILQWLESYAQL